MLLWFLRQSHWSLFVLQAVEKTGTSLPARVHDIMNRWVLQMGFPVVSIDTATGTVTQQHFLLDPDSVVNRPSEFEYVFRWLTTWVTFNLVSKIFVLWLCLFSLTDMYGLCPLLGRRILFQVKIFGCLKKQVRSTIFLYHIHKYKSHWHGPQF